MNFTDLDTHAQPVNLRTHCPSRQYKMSGLGGKGYVPPPSIGHELGIMFGFLGAMALCMIAYSFAWRHGNKVGQKREAERIEAVKASGWLNEKQESDEERKERAGEEVPS
ncbi:hypothetical protein LTR08_007827 [Meristemomyces frigidus]|nr:hypothetical protein LTR08_007827 [Meristemomyces frigidus]